MSGGDATFWSAVVLGLFGFLGTVLTLWHTREMKRLEPASKELSRETPVPLAVERRRRIEAEKRAEAFKQQYQSQWKACQRCLRELAQARRRVPWPPSS